MSKSLYLLIGSFLLFIFVAAAMLQALVTLQRVASVSDLRGDVRIQHRATDAFNPLGATRYVRAGDVIQTGQGSLTLNWVDGTRVRVGPETTLHVLRCSLNSATNAAVSVFRLDLGQVWIRVRRLLSPRSKFEVLTPTATAGVRGTVFSVTVDPGGGTQVSVLEGQVTLARNDSDASVAVDRGRCGVVEAAAAGQAPLAVENLTDAQRTAWRQAQAIESPFVSITYPAYATARLNGPACCRVAGLAEEDARVTVNGRPVAIGKGGRFSVEVPAKAGSNLRLEVAAQDKSGIRTVITRTVHVTPSLATP